MKLHSNPTQVHVTGGETQQFGLEFNSKIVHMLSNTLYSNKILAIIRELSTNAYDSHVANGNKDHPFEVKLPDYNNPNFIIRDFGTGMSPDTMKNIYSVYGKSEKSSSNEYIGCLGLGSKSPFCYHTKTFTVESFYNGNKYMYVCYLNNEGMPAYTEMESSNTSEVNGVRITIPVDSKDFNNFSETAKNFYCYFNPLPKINCSIYKINYHEKKNLYGIRDDNGSAKVVMGNLSYPVSLSNCSDEESKLLSSPIDLFFDVGQIDINISREGLSYDNLTINRLKHRVQVVIADFVKDIENHISQADCLFDAHIRFLDLKHYKKKFIDYDKVLWNNQPLKSKVDVKADSFGYPYKTIRESSIFNINKDLKFFKKDLKTGNIVRLIQELNGNGRAVIATDENQDLIIKEFGILPSYIKNISDIKYSPTKKSRVSRTGTKIMRWKQLFVNISYCWENIEYDLKNGGYYVPIKGFQCSLPKGNDLVDRIVNVSNNFKLDIKTIYGIREKYIKDLGKNWINAYDYVLNYLKKVDTKSLQKEYDKFLIAKYLHSDYKYNFLKGYLDIIPDLSDYNTIDYCIYNKVSLLEFFGVSYFNNTTVNVEKLFNETLDKYPILFTLHHDKYKYNNIIRNEISKILGA